MTSLAYEVFRLLTCCDLHFIQLDDSDNWLRWEA
jgi:hypothetical protein